MIDITGMLFDSWQGLVRVLLVGTLAYFALVLFLRISGKRTLSKMNAFDMIVTVALGSTLATIILSKDVALIEGVFAFILLIGLQYIVTWTSVRSEAVKRVTRSEPSLLLYRGRMMDSALQQQRVLAEEVRAAVRGHGIAALEEVETVILETDGSFSVVARSNASPTAIQPEIADYPPV